MSRLMRIVERAVYLGPSIYAHFAGIDDVIAALLDRSFGQLFAQVQEAISATDEPHAALRAAAHAYVAFGWAHPALYRMMFAATGYAEHAVDTYTLVEETIARCAEPGQTAGHDPHQDTYLLWVALHGIATLSKPDRQDYRRLGPIDREAAIDLLVDRLVRI